jgi:hypothetical protein
MRLKIQMSIIKISLNLTEDFLILSNRLHLFKIYLKY